MVMPETIDNGQRALLQAVWQLMLQHDRWPTFAEVDRHLYRSLDLDAHVTMQGLPRELLYPVTNEWPLQPGEALRLTVAGASTCVGSAELLKLFVDVIRLAADLEHGWMGPPVEQGTEPTLSSGDLKDHLTLPAAGRESLLSQLGNLLSVEPWGWTSGGLDGTGRWRFSFDRRVRRFRDVTDVQDYWSRRTAQADIRQRSPQAGDGSVPAEEDSTPVAASPPAVDAAEEAPWLDPVSEDALRAVVPRFMPPTSAALYARWWQLETWLRELCYVELRALHGVNWQSVVKNRPERQAKDAAFTHMSGPDNDNPLAYLDYSQLLDLIDRHWDQFSYALLPLATWKGRQDELKQIRHRIGHLRRPHTDDLNRLDLTLRDLERGAFIALASYNDGQYPDSSKHRDPVTQGWVDGRHEAAQRLLTHALRQYDTRLMLRVSRRPWASFPADLTDAPGVLWHADFYLGDRAVDVAELWRDTDLDGVRPLLMHLRADDPGHIRFTFCAADKPESVADAVGEAFDAVLGNARRSDVTALDYQRWRRKAQDLDYRVLCGSGWNTVDSATAPTSIFHSGGGVGASPRW
ncbi:MAG TPA: hypothetical protein VGB75_10925 [Jatrophihabitans sp.]|uniref:hypothetical protein n=1 Tax=Jatrophihabitans sp. TaxID=1932789 RepID=UPI002F187430